jgi:hypothetical protein
MGEWSLEGAKQIFYVEIPGALCFTPNFARRTATQLFIAPLAL